MKTIGKTAYVTNPRGPNGRYKTFVTLPKNNRQSCAKIPIKEKISKISIIFILTWSENSAKIIKEYAFGIVALIFRARVH